MLIHAKLNLLKIETNTVGQNHRHDCDGFSCEVNSTCHGETHVQFLLIPTVK